MKIFETKRCLIRPFEVRDMEQFMEYRNDLDWMKYQGFKDKSKDEYIDSLVIPFNIMNHSQLAITNKNGELIGDLYVKKNEDNVHVGYTIHPKFSRQGYAFEATMGLIEYVRSIFPNIDIVSGVTKENLPSIYLLEKLGFTRIGENEEEYSYKYKEKRA